MRWTISKSLPHTRGGVSPRTPISASWTSSSPHPWGCFPCALPAFSFSIVFPTPVGVFLPSGGKRKGAGRLPHTRGGVSGYNCYADFATASSPHPWGCFYNSEEARFERLVFPTPVGVFPTMFKKAFLRGRLPHTRGGVSAFLNIALPPLLSSPHPWGCFCRSGPGGRICAVFPTPVGVFLSHFLVLS